MMYRRSLNNADDLIQTILPVQGSQDRNDKNRGVLMEERREISRVEYKTNGVVVICDTQEKIYVDVKDISPLGMGICVPEGHEGLLGKQVIVVAETLIMYAEVSREEKQEDGSTFIGVHAIKFTDDVLQYLFSHIG